LGQGAIQAEFYLSEEAKLAAKNENLNCPSHQILSLESEINFAGKQYPLLVDKIAYM